MRRALLFCFMVTFTASAQEYRTGAGIFWGEKRFKMHGAFSEDYDFTRHIQPSQNKKYEYLGLHASFGIGEKNRFRTSLSVYDDLSPRNFELVYSRRVFPGIFILAGFQKYDLLYEKDYFVDYRSVFPGFTPFYAPDNGGYYFSTRELFTGVACYYSKRHWEINAEVQLGFSGIKSPSLGSQYYTKKEEVYKVDIKLRPRPELLAAFRVSAGFYPFSRGRLGLQAQYRLSGNRAGIPSYERITYHWTTENPQHETVRSPQQRMVKQDLDFGLNYRF